MLHYLLTLSILRIQHDKSTTTILIYNLELIIKEEWHIWIKKISDEECMML